MINHKIKLAAVVCIFLLAASAARGEEGKGLSVDPSTINVGLMYSGSAVKVDMKTGAGYGIVIRIKGHEEDMELKEKGKRFGLFWMSVGNLELKSVPSLYMVASSGKLADMADRNILEDLGIGYEALFSGIMPDIAEDEKKFFFGELIKLKEKMKLFSVKEGGLEVRDAGGGLQEVSGEFRMPSKAPVGEYEVTVFGFIHGGGEVLDSGKIKLEFTPATALMTNMAHRHGLLYGILASIVAIVAGLITGMIFKGKGAH